MSKTNFCLILILILAFGLRFYRLGDRWQVFADMARDILVGREALKLGVSAWPLVGSFSSAGPFVFGPLFYWLISLSYLPFINFLPLPWLVVGSISIAFVWVMGQAGKKFGGTRMGLLLAFLAAISPAQNFRALVLTQHSLIAISGAVALWAFINFLQKQKAKFLFYMGLSLGFALSMHYQAINLLPFGLFALFASFRSLKLLRIFKNLAALILGFFIPSLPLLYWDYLQGWANTLNILDYLLIGQNRIYVANRWLTYVFQFWPDFWASVVSGQKLLAWVFILGTALLVFVKILKKKLNLTLLFLVIIFLIQFVLLRYHKGERFEGYLIYLHPLILFFSAWVLESLWSKWRLAGFILLVLITFSSLKIILPQIKTEQNQAPQLKKAMAKLQEIYPGKKFSLWDYKNNSTGHSFGLSAFLDSQNLIDPSDGLLLGVCLDNCQEQFPLLVKLYNSVNLVNLSSKSKKELQENSWKEVNPHAVYEDVALWWQKEKLKSSFNLGKYIQERLGLIR